MPRCSILLLVLLLLSSSRLIAQPAIDQAEELMLHGQWEQAMTVIQEHSTENINWKILEAEIIIRSGEERQGQTMLEELYEQAPSALSNVQKLDLEIRLLSVYAHRRKKVEAQRLYAIILPKEARIPEDMLGYWYKAKGFFHRFVSGDADASWKAFQQVVTYYENREHTDPVLLGSSLRELGNKARTRLGLEEAINYYRLELQVYEQFFGNDHFLVSIPYYNLGTVYYEQSEYQQAIDHFLITYHIWDSLGPPSKAYFRYLLEAIGDMYWELEDREHALHFFDLAMEGAPVVNHDLGVTLTRQADSLLSAGEIEAAELSYRSALDFRIHALGDKHPLTGGCNNYLAHSAAKKGEYLEALDLYQRSIRMLNEGEVPDSWDQPILLKPGTGSEAYLLDALSGKCRMLLQLYHRDGNQTYLHAATNTASQAVELVDLIRVRPISFESKSFWSERAFPVLDMAVEAAWLSYEESGHPQDLQDAFRYSEKARAFLLLQSAQFQQATQSSRVSAEILGKEKQLRADIQEYRLKILQEEQRCGESRSKLLDLWREELFRLERSYEQFLAMLQDEFPGYFKLKYEVDVMSATAVQAELSPGEVLIEFFEGDHHLYVFCLSHDTFRSIRIDRNRYASDLSIWRQHLTNPDSFLTKPDMGLETFTALAHSLFETLISSILPDQVPNRIICIPDGSLSGLPLGILLTETSGPSFAELPYWFLSQPIYYSPSATLLFLTHRAQESDDWLGIAPDYQWEGDNIPPPLQHNDQEIDQGYEIWKGKRMLHQDATETLFRLQAPESQILHIAAHARINDSEPGLSHFVLKPDEGHDGLLHTYELYGLQLQSSLAILSACNTGTGSYQRGEGLMSLARAFQFAGCPSLIASFWTVDDQSTATLIKSCYEAMESGQPVSIALQTARIAYLKSASPTRQHPFFWAGFTPIGKDMVVRPEPLWMWWLAGISGLIFLTMGGYRYYRKTSIRHS